MLTYEVKLKKMGEMTNLPDSQRLFGFLIYQSKQFFSEEDISDFVEKVKEKQQKCMISSLIPSGYYPIPKEYIFCKLEKSLAKNREKIGTLEQNQLEVKAKVDELIRELEKKQNSKEDERKGQNKEQRTEKEIQGLKSKIIEGKKEYNSIADSIYDLSIKGIYETLKKMQFIEKTDLKEILDLAEKGQEIKVKDLEKRNYLKQEQSFIQKAGLVSETIQIPGIPNSLYSLPILTFEDKNGKIQKEFSFWVQVEEGSLIANTMEKMKEGLKNNEIPCFLGVKASSGFNKYSIDAVCKNDESSEKTGCSKGIYLNLGVLLPQFDKIDIERSILEIHTSDRKPFEIENEVSKFISFVTAGSVINLKEGITDISQVGLSIDNSKYNPLYKNAIIFGNSYFVELEVANET
ncbi:MAG: hypothetical protein Q4A29_06960 [Eubacteriales bacterium]|nr:hypothetical protein [Eubacteriales bacterium]